MQAHLPQQHLTPRPIVPALAPVKVLELARSIDQSAGLISDTRVTEPPCDGPPRGFNPTPARPKFTLHKDNFVALA